MSHLEFVLLFAPDEDPNHCALHDIVERLDGLKQYIVFHYVSFSAFPFLKKRPELTKLRLQRIKRSYRLHGLPVGIVKRYQSARLVYFKAQRTSSKSTRQGRPVSTDMNCLIVCYRFEIHPRGLVRRLQRQVACAHNGLAASQLGSATNMR